MFAGNLRQSWRTVHPSAVAEIPVAFMCPCKLAPVVLDMTIIVVLVVSKVCTLWIIHWFCRAFVQVVPNFRVYKGVAAIFYHYIDFLHIKNPGKILCM